MTTLVLLPGMDGTGVLFDPFVKAIASHIDVKVVAYPTTCTAYEDLVEIAACALPGEDDFVILGESFSGPVAVSLAARRPRGLMGLILCCTFARNPRPHFSGLRSFVGRLPALRPPMGLLKHVLMGGFATRGLQAALETAMAQVPPATLRGRLQSVLDIDVAAGLQEVEVPILYLRARQDRLVPSAASELIQRIRPRMQILDIDAPHFLLQTRPDAAADAIERFLMSPDCAKSRPRYSQPP